jgi:hypothetical protein
MQGAVRRGTIGEEEVRAPVIVLAGITRGCGGLWAFLTAWSRGRTRIDLERERNLGTAQALRLLPPGAELVEGDPSGWRRVIRIPSPTTAPPATISSAPGPARQLRS